MKHELVRGALGVNSRRNDAHRRDSPAATAPLAKQLSASAFRTLDPGIQGQWESRWWPLEPWPRHLLPSTSFPVARDESFLRRERDRTLSGGFPFSSAKNRRIGAFGEGRSKDEEEDEE